MHFRIDGDTVPDEIGDDVDLGHDRCIDRHGSGEECDGPTVLRPSLSGTGTSIARCDRHWERRLDEEDRLRRDYPDSPNPPSWFDPTYAGEHWDSDY